MDTNNITNLLLIIDLFLSLSAIFVSIETFRRQIKQSILENKPDCRVKAFSLGKKVDICLENVGSGIMIVEKIFYKIDGEDTPSESLSPFFYGIPCETRSQVIINNEHLFPQSKHHLFSSTFPTQKDLLRAWNIIQHLEVYISYHSVFKKKSEEKQFTLKKEYQSFLAALKEDDNGPKEHPNFRQLMAYKDNSIYRTRAYQKQKLCRCTHRVKRMRPRYVQKGRV